MKTLMIGVAAATLLFATHAVGQVTPRSISPLSYSCGPQADALALLQLEQASGSLERKAADLEAGQKAIALAAAIQQSVSKGQGLEPYGGAAFYYRLSNASKSPRLAELFRRTAKDQFVRSHHTAATQGISWASVLTDNARHYAYRNIARDGCGVDEDNTAWLKADLSQNGWFTLTEFGKEADQAAFLIVQHADRDREFQAQVISLLEPLAAQGRTRPANYAYLFDRLAVGRKAQQRYGTQGRCMGPGVWEPFELEDPAGLDQRRATMGLPPHSEYKALFVKICR